jgi:aconitase A
VTDEQVKLVETYAKTAGLWADSLKNAEYERVLNFDLSSVVRNMAGPSNPMPVLPPPIWRRALPASGQGNTGADAGRRRDHRRHHQLHQHQQPAQRDCRRRCWRATPTSSA